MDASAITGLLTIGGAVVVGAVGVTGKIFADYMLTRRERDRVTRARQTIGCHQPPLQFLWQHHGTLVRKSTLMPPLRSGICAQSDGR